jgi:hypothetical protein
VLISVSTNLELTQAGEVLSIAQFHFKENEKLAVSSSKVLHLRLRIDILKPGVKRYDSFIGKFRFAKIPVYWRVSHICPGKKAQHVRPTNFFFE